MSAEFADYDHADDTYLNEMHKAATGAPESTTTIEECPSCDGCGHLLCHCCTRHGEDKAWRCTSPDAPKCVTCGGSGEVETPNEC